MRFDHLLLCVPAGLFWLWYVWRRSGPRPPPRRLVVLALVLGGVSTAGAISFHTLVETHAVPWLSSLSPDRDFFSALAYFVVLVGLVEESCKMLAVRGSVYYSPTFDDPLQGVMYSSAAALGFATVENARYAGVHGGEVMIGRAVLSTFGHVLLSMVWGFALGAQRTSRATGIVGWLRGWILLVVSVILGGIVHGIYDFFLFYDHMWLALVLLFALWRIFVSQTAPVCRQSTDLARPCECTHCQGPARDEGRSRGHEPAADGSQACMKCGKGLGPDAVCGHCGLAPR